MAIAFLEESDTELVKKLSYEGSKKLSAYNQKSNAKKLSKRKSRQKHKSHQLDVLKGMANFINTEAVKLNTLFSKAQLTPVIQYMFASIFL